MNAPGGRTYSADEKIAALRADVDTLKLGVATMKALLQNMAGNPAIQGYFSKKLDLNDNLDVVKLYKRLSTIEADIIALTP